MKNKTLLLSEVSAEIRNKLQPAKTILEFLKAGKKLPMEFIEIALKDLEEVTAKSLN